MTIPQLIRIGTRASALAIAQSEEVKRRLLAAYPRMQPHQLEIVPMTTTGDAIQHKTLNEIGGKGLFTKEIEDALLDGSVDIAVHSMKDMPTQLPDGLSIPCILEREDPRDAFLSRYEGGIDALPLQAVVGTASLRRAAQIKAYRPDVQIVPLRGNVQTRLRKLSEGECDATLLAMAGLKRLGMDDLLRHPLEESICLPAVAQGAIGVECRTDRPELAHWLNAIHHDDSGLCVAAERSLLQTLDGSCRTPIAALALREKDTLWLRAVLAKPDGSVVLRDEIRCSASLTAAISAGEQVGKRLLAQAGNDFLCSLSAEG